MNTKTQIRIAAFSGVLLAAAGALAGPPLICRPFEIGGARSLPWKDGSGWRGEDPTYKLSGLTEDTLALLTPSTPILVRMETMRRAAIYAAKDTAAADTLTARLMARILDSEAKRQPDARAWFDAGYFVETLRQATFVYRYEMLSPAERTDWKLRGPKPWLDGHRWVKRAIKLGGQDMHVALSLIEEYREADLKQRAPVVVSARD